jgi:1-acyl-sn-glycerol-3-phosphate acyltransferase
MTVVLVPNASVPPANGAREAASHVAPAIAEVIRLLGLPDPEGPAASELPGPPVAPLEATLRYWFSRLVARFLVGAMTRLRVVGLERLPPGPAILCFSHQSWADPFILMAALPGRPRLYFFGPREADMRRGARNRLMSWVGTSVPFSPDRRDMAGATRTVGRICRAGARLAIAGEGAIHVGERALLPLSQGPAYFAHRFGVPLVPVAINGTGWLAWGRTVRVSVGDPIVPSGPRERGAIAGLTASCEAALRALVADFPDRPAPGPFGRWLTELFNEWPGGRRPDGPP